jgi:hypothetical protein
MGILSDITFRIMRKLDLRGIVEIFVIGNFPTLGPLREGETHSRVGQRLCQRLFLALFRNPSPFQE